MANKLILLIACAKEQSILPGRNLFLVEKMLGPTLVSIHNLRFFQRWMAQIRWAIKEGKLGKLVAPSDEIVEK